MKKIIFLTATAAILILATPTFAFGQQTSKSDMNTIARKLATQIPEIKEILREPDELGENYYHFNDAEKGDSDYTINVKIHRYKRPTAANDLVLVAYNNHDNMESSWLKCFTHDRKTGVLTEVEVPFEMPCGVPDCSWRISYDIFDNGNLQIDTSPGLASAVITVVRWNEKTGFTPYKRHISIPFLCVLNDEIYVNCTDNAETEQYVQKVIRPNFQRINAIKEWAWVEERIDCALFEDVKATSIAYYYSDSILEKIVAKLHSKTHESIVEYYFLDGCLSFAYDITTQYDAPNTKTERRWYLKYIEGYTACCFRGIGDNGKKLTREQIEEDFLNNRVYFFYQLILSQ
jgi:hypothetical protein